MHSTSKSRSTHMPAKLASFAEAFLNGLKDAALLLDENLLIENLNLAYCDYFGVSAEEVFGRSVLELGHGPWQNEDLRQFVTNLQKGKPASDQLVLSLDSKESGRRSLQFYGRRLDNWPLILVKFADVTPQEHARHQC